MPIVRTNLSQMAREIDQMGKAVFDKVGDALAQGIWEEFVVLLYETPQWTGTTAASWNLSMGGDHSVREQPERSRKQALSKGHDAAVQIAKAHNFKSLLAISTEYKQKAIVVENHAEGAERAELGPVRDINEPAKAMARFEQRVKQRSFPIIWDRLK